MSDKPITTSWMWKQEDGEIWGLTLDTDARKVEWFDGIGCACGDSFAVQSFDDFLAKGPRYGEPPDDTLGEIYASLHTLQQSAS
jgi:hypothetical protein